MTDEGMEIRNRDGRRGLGKIDRVERCGHVNGRVMVDVGLTMEVELTDEGVSMEAEMVDENLAK